MLERELEPELMDDGDEAESYDEMDHSEVNRLFVEDFLKDGPAGEEVIDLGTGTAQIPIVLCESDETCKVMASDAAVSMLEIAKINVAAAGFEHRIQLHHGDSKSIGFEDESFDSAISNSLIHHLPTPLAAMEQMVRIVRPGGRIFVRDLMRPGDLETVESLVSTYAANETEQNRQLLRQSLIAALTLEEIQELVETLGYSGDSVRATSDRHWTWNATKPV